MELLEQQHPPARHLHPRGVRERRRASSPRPAARPTPRCTCRRWRTSAGIEFDLFDVAEIFKSTPYIADLKPGGKYVAKDMHDAGGVYMLMKTLLDGGFLDGDCMTVTGKTLGENIDEITWNPDQKVIYHVDDADHADRRRRRPARARSRPTARS